MNNVSSMLYQAVVRYAEGGERVTKVSLPAALFAEYAADTDSQQMFCTLKIDIAEGTGVEPHFEMEKKR